MERTKRNGESTYYLYIIIIIIIINYYFISLFLKEFDVSVAFL